MENKGIYFLINILLIFRIVSINFEIYPLNEIGDSQTLEIDKNKKYYFFSPVVEIKLGEPISYFISKDIRSFNISFIFLDSDTYNDITEERINNYSFNKTLGFLDNKKYFKTMFKTNNNQKGLFFVFEINNCENTDNFTISRINLTIIEPTDKTFTPNKFNYFFINFAQYKYLYDIFIFSSNAESRIKLYYIINKDINEYGKNQKYILLNDYNYYIYYQSECGFIHIDYDY